VDPLDGTYNYLRDLPICCVSIGLCSGQTPILGVSHDLNTKTTYSGALNAEHNAVGRFPEPGDDELLAGPARNFQVFDPLDFLAEVTQHIPDPGEHLIRYYGWYSNLPAPRLRQADKTRGQRAQRQPAAAGTGIPARSPSAREARKGLAALIKQVYEADPLCCPKCGSAMKIISFIVEVKNSPMVSPFARLERTAGLA
jgi:hypothetical protein